MYAIRSYYDTGHPMEALQASIAALGMFYPDRDPLNAEDRYNSVVRLIAKAPTLVVNCTDRDRNNFV